MKWEKFNQELQDFVRVSVDNKTKKYYKTIIFGIIYSYNFIAIGQR